MTDFVGVRDLALALRALQREYGLSSISGTVELEHDSLTIRFQGLGDPALLYLENARGDLQLVVPEFLS